MKKNQGTNSIDSHNVAEHTSVLVRQHTARINRVTIHLRLFGPSPHWVLKREQHDATGEIHHHLLPIPNLRNLKRFVDGDPFVHQLKRAYDDILQTVADDFQTTDSSSHTE
ncbi:hypothetical protein KDW40_01990 [Burkholderia cenocepacia]|uniref:hypothetical protein n=1 Tax=Burkholderia cenocepacia TaxID=95486 RepID=UPI001B98ADE0|nr:hypothetical protein [Burkholderia cenocepacia]MBR8043129.1 hypothetical protein [Burkholderia cenocepacia]MBR8324501.1 hypothetical protein [Burkholderia cenocepacia]